MRVLGRTAQLDAIALGELVRAHTSVVAALVDLETVAAELGAASWAPEALHNAADTVRERTAELESLLDRAVKEARGG